MGCFRLFNLSKYRIGDNSSGSYILEMAGTVTSIKGGIRILK